jgi:hypothetical protein
MGRVFHPEGRALLLTVTIISSIGFLMIGFDNGLMGGFSTFHSPPTQSMGFL